jgi:CRP-like cAMP-binding protein
MIAVDVLRQYGFFGGLSDTQLDRVAAIASEVTFPVGSLIQEECKPVTMMCVLVSGDVELLHEPADGQPMRHVGMICVNEPFNIASLVEPYEAQNAVRAVSEVKLIGIDAVQLRELCGEDPQIGYKLMLQCVRQLRERLNGAQARLAAAGVNPDA